MRLIRRLVAGRVDFVVIGGLAVIAHGYPRITKDVDIVYARSPANLERLGSVLQDVRARLAGVDDGVPFVPDARSLQRTSILTLDSDEGLIDLLAEPAGAASYDELRARAEIADFGDVHVPIADLDDLIAMKRAAGRPQDLADLEALAVIRRLRRERRR
jgi:hypothetical protein